MTRNQELKNHISDINRIFVGKLMKGEYKLREFNGTVAQVSVLGYDFSLWMGNGVNHFKTYVGYKNFMVLTFSEDEKASLYKHFDELKTADARALAKKEMERAIAHYNSLTDGKEA